MATTRETRHRRSRSDLSSADRAPRERSQVFAHAVPTPAQLRNVEDMQLLRSAFGNFFSGAGNFIEAMMESEKQDRLLEVRFENEQQKAQGVADAEAGRDAALPDDLDYMTAFARTKGINVGGKAATDFLAALSSQPLGSDPEAFREKWFKEQLGDGTGDPIHDAAMFATFKDKTDAAVLAFRIDNAKDLRQKGIASLNEEIFSKAETAGGDDIRDWMARMTALNLGDNVKGRALVLSAMKQAAITPTALQRITSSLHAKGYMEDGRSFAEAFPLTAQEFSEAATQSFMQSLSAEAHEGYTKIAEQARNPDVMADERSVMNLIAEADNVLDRFGGPKVHGPLVNSLRDHLEKLILKNVEFNQFVMKGLSGGFPVDQEQINKYLPSVLSKRLALRFGQPVHPLASAEAAEEAAFVVSHYHGIDPDTKATMSAGLQDVKTPEAQANAFRFYARLQNEGRDVSQYMTADAYKAFTAIDGLFRTTAKHNVDNAVKLYGANPALAKEIDQRARGTDWPTLMGRVGDPRERVLADVAADLKEGVAEKLGVTRFFGLVDAPGRVAMSPAVEGELLADFARTLVTYQAIGVPDAHERARTAVVEGLASNFLTIPGPNGAVQLVRKRDFPAFNGQNNVGPGQYYNGKTGEMENTLEVFRRDITGAKDILPGIFSDPASIFVSRGKGHVTPDGSFLLMNGETLEPITFATGQTLARDEKGEKQLTLSSDIEGAKRDLESILPEHFRVEREDGAFGSVLRVFYKFHLSEPEDLAALAARHKRQPRTRTGPIAVTPGGAVTGRTLRK